MAGKRLGEPRMWRAEHVLILIAEGEGSTAMEITDGYRQDLYSESTDWRDRD